jgi:hypothetical protein
MSDSKLVIKDLSNNKQELVELTDKQTGDVNGGYYYPLPIYYPTLQDFAIANQAAFEYNMNLSDVNHENFLNNVIRA